MRHAFLVVKVVAGVVALVVLSGETGRALSQEGAAFRVEASGSDGTGVPLDQPVPLLLRGSPYFSPAAPAPFQVVVPETLQAPVLAEVVEFRIEHRPGSPRRSGTAGMIFLVTEHGAPGSRSSVYTVPTTLVQHDAERHVTSVATSLLSHSSLQATISQAATFGGSRGRGGRIYAGVATFTRTAGQIYLVELKVP